MACLYDELRLTCAPGLKWEGGLTKIEANFHFKTLHVFLDGPYSWIKVSERPGMLFWQSVWDAAAELAGSMEMQGVSCEWIQLPPSNVNTSKDFYLFPCLFASLHRPAPCVSH